MHSNITSQLQELFLPYLKRIPLETESLFSSGLLDSISLIEIVQLIESRWAIQYHWTEMTLDNLDTLIQIAAFIERKRPANDS